VFFAPVRREVNPMRRISWLVAVTAAICFGGPGCMSTQDARYVYQDGQYGVIGIPRNTSIGKKDFRAQAHELMIMHFPEGYEIVRAEEVVEGDRTLDTARRVELDSEPGFAALNQMIKVGKFAKSTSSDQKDSVKITESRIIYRRKPDGQSKGRDGFTDLAGLSPELYIDPNQVMRKELKDGPLLAKKDTKADDKKVADAKSKDAKEDPSAQKAANTTSN
jgi:hypothetical protein